MTKSSDDEEKYKIQSSLRSVLESEIVTMCRSAPQVEIMNSLGKIIKKLNGDHS